MGNIITFRRIKDDVEPRPKIESDGSGEIVIFPGVRIERHDTVDLSHRVMAIPAID